MTRLDRSFASIKKKKKNYKLMIFFINIQNYIKKITGLFQRNLTKKRKTTKIMMRFNLTEFELVFYSPL